MFCALNNIPMRGHQKIGSMKDIDIRQMCITGEQDIFRAFLAFKQNVVTQNFRHSETSNKNCIMISSTVQNEII